MTDLLTGLNPQQHQAVTAPDGPVLVLAGPGSGKTRVLTHRVAWLIQERNLRPSHLMAVTFTNKAARQMQNRINDLLGGKLRGLTVGTFHATCARLLRIEAEHLPITRDYVIYDTADQRALLKQAVADLNMDDKRFPPARMGGIISRAKNELITPEFFRSESYFEEAAGRVYERYQQLLVTNNAADFDDLLMYVAILLRDNEAVRFKYQQRYDYVLVDEFQDTNSAQYVLLRHLAEAHRNLYCVGDADQSIYRWRGADYRNIKRLTEDFSEAKTVLLEQNYRSTQIILDGAMAVIDRNPHRFKKKLFTEREGGLSITRYEAYDETDEAQFVVQTIATLIATEGVEPRDCAVMYRTNAQSRAFEETFIRANLPYRIVGSTRFYDRKEIKDLLAYLRLVHNPADSVALLRIINTPARTIGKTTIGTLQEWATERGSSLWDALEAILANEPSPFGTRPLKALRGFAAMVAGWRQIADKSGVYDLLGVIIDETGFHDYVNDGTEEGASRWENVQELRNVTAEYRQLPLSTFLEDVALVADIDQLPEDVNAPTLLTLHAAKGLEYPVVFITGVEEGLMPHQRSFDDPEAMEEERRLMYVGMTRAEDRLYLVHAFRRTVWGESTLAMPSPYLADIPGELLTGNVSLDTGVSITRRSGRQPQNTSWTPTRAAQPAPGDATYRAGQRVRHNKFGEGIVIESRVIGDEEEVSVAFEENGLKRLMASLAPMEILD